MIDKACGNGVGFPAVGAEGAGKAQSKPFSAPEVPPLTYSSVSS